MEAVLLIYSFLLMAFIVLILHLSGVSETIYLLVYTSPKSRAIGKTIFGIGQSIVAAVIFAILTTQTGFDAFLVIRYATLTVIGIVMIVSGQELEEK